MEGSLFEDGAETTAAASGSSTGAAGGGASNGSEGVSTAAVIAAAGGGSIRSSEGGRGSSIGSKAGISASEPEIRVPKAPEQPHLPLQPLPEGAQA
jgi:hypothetical protein